MNDSIHKLVSRVLQILFILGFVCVAVVGAIVSYPKYRQARGLEETRSSIERQINEKMREIAEIKAKQRRFNTDREFVESLARRDRRIFPGELVFVFDD